MQLSEKGQFRLQRRWLLMASRWGAAMSIRGACDGPAGVGAAVGANGPAGTQVGRLGAVGVGR
jgi:hypothetical protein